MTKLCDDLLCGAGVIATRLFGRDNKRNRRRVYYRFEKGRFGSAVWKEPGGGELISRESLLDGHYRGAPVEEPAE